MSDNNSNFKNDLGIPISNEVMERNTKCFIKALSYCIAKGYGIIVEENDELFIVNRIDNFIGCTSIDNLHMSDEDRKKMKPGIIIKLNEASSDV